MAIRFNLTNVSGAVDSFNQEFQKNDSQAQVIETLDRDIIVVPDRDKAGQMMVNAALKYGWSVAFPEWGDGIKDVADAVAKYGQLFTMRSILDSVQANKLKIQLHTRKWF